MIDLKELERQAIEAGKLTVVDLAGGLQQEWDDLPPSLKEEVKKAAEDEARAKIMGLAGFDPSKIITPANRAHNKAMLNAVKVGGRIALYDLMVKTVDGVIVRLLSLAGSTLKKLIGL